jgi:hypothetical protein
MTRRVNNLKRADAWNKAYTRENIPSHFTHAEHKMTLPTHDVGSPINRHNIERETTVWCNAPKETYVYLYIFDKSFNASRALTDQIGVTIVINPLLRANILNASDDNCAHK